MDSISCVRRAYAAPQRIDCDAALMTGTLRAQSSARFFFRQFISTVAFCHRHHIAHRDLKLDNALLDTEHPPRILLTDFGFAARWGAGETPNMRGHLGCRPCLPHD